MKIKKLLLLTFLSSINFSIFSLDPLVSQLIRKSRPDQLRKLLEYKKLSSEDKKLCINLAKEMVRQRKIKSDINCITSTSGRKTPSAGAFWLLGSMIAGYIGIDALGRPDNGLNGPMSMIIGGIAFYSAYKMFEKGGNLNKEELKSLRSNKEKYLDSIEIKHILES